MTSGSYVMMRISSLMISSIQLKYYAWDISHKKSVSDDSRFTGVLSEARVDLIPHQVEAALFAFKSPLSKGAILADEVGLGKTIEAGIILSEYNFASTNADFLKTRKWDLVVFDEAHKLRNVYKRGNVIRDNDCH